MMCPLCKEEKNIDKIPTCALSNNKDGAFFICRNCGIFFGKVKNEETD